MFADLDHFKRGDVSTAGNVGEIDVTGQEAVREAGHEAGEKDAGEGERVGGEDEPGQDTGKSGDYQQLPGSEHLLEEPA